MFDGFGDSGSSDVAADRCPRRHEELTALRQVAERAQAVYLARLARFEASDGFRADGYGSAWTWLRDQARALPAEARSEVWLARRLHTDVIRAMPATERALVRQP